MRLDELAVAADPMTSLPPIPDEAKDAAMAVCRGSRGYSPEQIAAAWPHLYAAALRHAAGLMTANAAEFGRQEFTLPRIAETLRLLASEAAP